MNSHDHTSTSYRPGIYYTIPPEVKPLTIEAKGNIFYHFKCATWHFDHRRHTQCICYPGSDCCCRCRVSDKLTVSPVEEHA